MTRIIWKMIKDELLLPYFDLKTEYSDLGLPERELVSSSFFTLALGQGLSAAIMNPHSIEMKKAYHSYLALAGLDESCVKYIEFATSIPKAVESVTASQKSEEEYKCIVDTMKRTVNDNLSLEDIAALNHVSVSYVKKLFQRYAGIGAKEYYSTLRYNEVIRLCESGAPIAEIAERLNFSSPEYLSLFFKKRMGVPPGRWRNTKK